MRAIICDDDEIILRGLRSVIDWASLGIELVGTAGNGKEGLALLKEQRPELLMTDIRMPEKIQTFGFFPISKPKKYPNLFLNLPDLQAIQNRKGLDIF